MEIKKEITRKRFFQIGGLMSAAFVLLKNSKLPFISQAKQNQNQKVEIRPNDLAVKREKRGTING
jgi:hypothetical protein